MTNIEKEKNQYFFAYHILSTALKTSNLNEGIAKSLDFTKECFDVNDIILYKMDDNGDYFHLLNQSCMESNSSITTVVLNTAKRIIEDKQFYQMKLNIGDIKSILFIPITSNNAKYIIAMSDNNKNININESSMNLFIESMQIILDKLEMINALKKDADIDALTGLDNRTSYEKAIEGNLPSDDTIYVLFDLLRLKNINDNYSHDLGDEYIKQTAEILKRIFPKYTYIKDSHGKSNKFLSGSCIYRIGGDEFVVISETESLENIKIKIMVAQEEVKNINLNINEQLGINCGLTIKENDETFRDLYLKADYCLSEDKRETYKTLRLDRRK